MPADSDLPNSELAASKPAVSKLPALWPKYLDVLNEEQRQAVLHSGSPLLILAGAGSGKTRVITTKIAWLIEQGADPRSIMAVTFTNKAAKEMSQRARQLEGRAADVMMRTFHSFGAWFLRRNGALAGLNPGFVIYDDEDAMSLLSKIMEGSPKGEVKDAAYKISRAKDYFLSPDDPALAAIDSREKFRKIYAAYEAKLAQIGNLDFGDLIKKPVEILRGQPQVAERFRARFSVIMVDEYQDANVAQFELLKELSGGGGGGYVCVVGDDDQSIYRFRGAEVKNILDFPKLFAGTQVIRLEKNYRSTPSILRAASSVVGNNKGRLGKTLAAERQDGKQPVLAFLASQDEEAAFCADLIQAAVEKGGDWAQWAILYRTNAQSLGFETEFLRRGIPYRVVGSLKFYQREEVKDALALLAFLANPRDEVAFRRVANKPARGIGAATLDKVVAAGEGGDLLEASRLAEASKRARGGLDAFAKVIEDGRRVLEGSGGVGASLPPASSPGEKGGLSVKGGEGLSLCVFRLVKDSGLADYHGAQDEDDGTQRLNNLQELVNAASLYPLNRGGLLDFLESIELDRSAMEGAGEGAASGVSENVVTLITFHNTKGLEFKRVVMTGLEQGTFPREDKSGEELEEERRLFYVGATRAMDELYLCCCATRRRFGSTQGCEPSVFLREIDKSTVRIIGKRPGGFAPAGDFAQGGSFALPAKNTPSQDARDLERLAGWRRGERLFHDDYGYGEVMSVKASEEGPAVQVRFESGQELRFLSEHQGSAITKIRE
ncbi:MAG: ATP-dependent helicase [Spirochaetes bacterium]|nr:ATP-dependent helicase [Spirochaetota bacterium]